ncbi:MAG: undecaprenyl-diphosphate phosphatase [Acidimicrobiia bacterium]
MLDAVVWGLIQGLTEFLPISSSGHLVLIPAVFDRPGPDLATTAMLHLGTLAAVVVYYRTDIANMARFDRPARRLITLIVLGSIPAVVLGLAFEDRIESLIDQPAKVAVMLVVTGVVLLGTGLLRLGDRTTETIRPLDSLLIGISQALALIPGISRSGMTISSGLVRGMGRIEAARFAFLLGIPAIAGAGLLEFFEFAGSDASVDASVWVGVGVAAVSGYAAIAFLIRLLSRIGLAPFGVYCVVAGTVAGLLL